MARAWCNALGEGPTASAVAEQTVYEVFAREEDEPLRYVGSVNAVSASLAENYARALYGEDAHWEEMAVVRRDAVHRIERPRPR